VVNSERPRLKNNTTTEIPHDRGRLSHTFPRESSLGFPARAPARQEDAISYWPAFDCNNNGLKRYLAALSSCSRACLDAAQCKDVM